MDFVYTFTIFAVYTFRFISKSTMNLHQPIDSFRFVTKQSTKFNEFLFVVLPDQVLQRKIICFSFALFIYFYVLSFVIQCKFDFVYLLQECSPTQSHTKWKSKSNSREEKTILLLLVGFDYRTFGEYWCSRLFDIFFILCDENSLTTNETK